MLIYLGLGFISICFAGLALCAYFLAETFDREFDKMRALSYHDE